MSLAQIGEFSFIIAGVGLSLGVIRPLPLPGRGRGLGADHAADAVADPLLGALRRVRRRPAAAQLQTYASLYGAWVQRPARDARAPDRVGAHPPPGRAAGRRRRADRGDRHRRVAVRGTACCGSRARSRTSRRRSRACCWSARRWRCIIPFILGAIRIARALGVALAAEALPAPAGGERELDLAAAPRRALLVTLQIAILLVAGVPVVALTQPFMPGIPGMAILLAGVALLVDSAVAQRHQPGGARARRGAGDPGGAGRPERDRRAGGRAHDAAAGAARRCSRASATRPPSRSPPARPRSGRTLKQINLRGLDRRDGDRDRSRRRRRHLPDRRRGAARGRRADPDRARREAVQAAQELLAAPLGSRVAAVRGYA